MRDYQRALRFEKDAAWRRDIQSRLEKVTPKCQKSEGSGSLHIDTSPAAFLDIKQRNPEQAQANYESYLDDAAREWLTARTSKLQTWNAAPIIQHIADTDSVAVGQLHSLLASESLPDPEEELCRTIIKSVLGAQRTEKVCLDLTLRDFIERPQFLELLDELPKIVESDAEGWESSESIVPIDHLKEPVRVAARFLMVQFRSLKMEKICYRAFAERSASAVETTLRTGSFT
jgi:hypothetical protein